jgi:pimeloyl-ACP methyl ester carboxylesterase
MLAAAGMAGAVLAADLARKLYQKSRLFAPERFPEGEWQPREHGLPAEDRWFRSSDGVRLHGWWIPRRDAACTLLFCHGNSGSIGHRLEELLYMAGLPVNIFAFDYRGYGRSSGAPSEEGLCRDARSAFRYVVEELGQPARTVILVGHSLGGAVAVDAAVELPAAGLVVQSSFTNVRDMARVLHPRLPMHWVATNQFRSVEKVRAIRMPKLFIHGTADETVPYVLGHQLFQEASSPKAFYTVPGAGHHDVHVHGGGGYRQTLERFFFRCL